MIDKEESLDIIDNSDLLKIANMKIFDYYNVTGLYFIFKDMNINPGIVKTGFKATKKGFTYFCINDETILNYSYTEIQNKITENLNYSINNKNIKLSKINKKLQIEVKDDSVNKYLFFCINDDSLYFEYHDNLDTQKSQIFYFSNNDIKNSIIMKSQNNNINYIKTVIDYLNILFPDIENKLKEYKVYKKIQKRILLLNRQLIVSNAIKKFSSANNKKNKQKKLNLKK